MITRTSCSYCSGNGRERGGSLCPVCQGLCKIYVRIGPTTLVSCPLCGSSGRDRDGNTPCPVCKGLGVIANDHSKVEIVRRVPENPHATESAEFISAQRLGQLRNCAPVNLDFTKLIRLCEEANICASYECWYAVATLTRSILDHVPPVFGMAKFAEVVANYAGTKSFKEAMRHLDEASRKIADSHLHERMRSSEVLPTEQQVNCGQQLDVLLAEIVRITPTSGHQFSITQVP